MNTNTAEKLEVETAPTTLAVYDEFKAQFAKLEEENKKLVFDYESKKGEKEARSHIATLRKSKTAVNDAHKTGKAAALKVCKQWDNGKRELIESIDDMIAVHMEPIEKKMARQQAILEELNKITRLGVIESTDIAASSAIQARIDAINSIDLESDVYGDQQKEAAQRAEVAIASLEKELALQVEREEQQAKIDALQAEADERERKAREERIANEAAAKVRLEEREAAARREETIKAEADRKIAEAAKQEPAPSSPKRKPRPVDEQKKHQAKVNTAAMKALMDAGLCEKDSKITVKAIALGQIPAVSISYD